MSSHLGYSGGWRMYLTSFFGGGLLFLGLVAYAIHCAALWIWNNTIPMLEFGAKLGVTFGMMVLGLKVIISAPHIFKLIGIVMFACGFFWACIAGFF